MAEPVIYGGQSTSVGILPQTVFGTAADETTVLGVIQVVDPPSIDFDFAVRSHEGKLAGLGRYRDVLDTQTDTKRAAPKIPLNGPVIRDCVAEYFYAFFQDVIEADTTPFKKTFTWALINPAFPDDAGFFVTICMMHPVAASSLLIKDCICEALSFKCEPGGRLEFSSNWIGCGAVDRTAAPEDAEDWTRRTENFFHYEDMTRFTLDFGAGAQNIYPVGGWELNFTQNVSLIGQDGSGNFKTFGIHDLGGTFKANILWDEHARSAQTNYATDIPIDLNIGFGSAAPAGTTDGDLDFAVVLKAINVTNVYEETHSCDIEGTICGRESDSTLPVTVILADAQDKTWPAV